MNTYKPMLAKPLDKPFNDPNWLFEVKWDGIRAIAYVGEKISLRSRNDKELVDGFPELRELKDLCSEVVLDGEIIVLKEGTPDFQAVAKRNHVTNPLDVQMLAAATPATYIVFDILERQGESLIDMPLTDRLQILSSSLKKGRFVVQSVTIEEYGVKYYEAAVQKGLEGVMAKRMDSMYQPGVRSGDWLKIKRVRACDCVVFGYTKGTGDREPTFGALILGLYDEAEPVYVGRVGTGFTDSELENVKNRLEALKTDKQWFIDPDIPAETTWVEPRLVAEVGYQQVTDDNRLRAPRFNGFRDDKPPLLCTMAQIRPQKLEDYYSKRDFTQTGEPTGGQETGTGNSFVIQEHHSRRLHWDFRLERGGVLISWAVPKGVPEEPESTHLAVHTEDHPIEYGGFEGIIPKGQYGAGEVKIWDKGFYVPIKWSGEKIEVYLAGQRLNGRYELVKMKDKEDWLILKKKKQ
jgi:DNA ligase D-like protein (predicted ligase)/DNA ligase D-like protein (predicted 3'-phosphoesterase)